MAARAFSVAYVVTLAAWPLTVQRGLPSGSLVVVVVVAIALATAALRMPLSPRVHHELWKATAGVSWVVMILTMPIFLWGLILVPLTVSLTIAAAGAWAD